jgi:glycosyltransferase involved in cell wall biosynthesis
MSNTDIIIQNQQTKRPFFSIIVPCYNTPLQYIKDLLSSIVDGGCNDELEIVIADGGSTDKSYQDEIENFKKEYSIPIITITMPDVNEDGVELLHCPGNTREYGSYYANGE